MENSASSNTARSVISRRKPSGAILPPVTQRPARLGVAVHEATLFVVHEQGVGGPLEELLEPSLALLERFFGLLALGDVARDRARRPLAVVGDHGRAGQPVSSCRPCGGTCALLCGAASPRGCAARYGRCPPC